MKIDVSKFFAKVREHFSSKMLEEEWTYFQEWARRFDDYPEDRRYGILPMGADTKEENMIYAPDPLELRVDHLIYLSKNGMNDGHRQRIFLNWLEKAEGKR